MRALFDLGHPAHFHLFRNAIAALRGAGHDAVIFARRKDCLPDLLAAAGWPCRLIDRPRHGLAALGAEALRVLREVVALARRSPFDLMVGTSIVAGPAARLTGATSIVFNEDDASVVPLFAVPAYAAAHYIVTPACLAAEDYGSRHLTYRGYQELAYLHPNRYRPDAGIRRLLGLGPGERYYLVRLVALRAHHDAGQAGLSADQARQVVRRLAPHGQVFVCSEGGPVADLGARPLPTPAERIFDVLAAADMVVGDSQTMAAEAAVLATPSLRCNTFVGRLSYLEELQHRYGLTVGHRPEQFAAVLAQIDEWLAARDLAGRWRARRDAMLAECVDVTAWMLELFDRLAARRAAARGRPPRKETP